MKTNTVSNLRTWMCGVIAALSASPFIYLANMSTAGMHASASVGRDMVLLQYRMRAEDRWNTFSNMKEKT